MMRPNHEFYCSVALLPGFRNWVEMTRNMQQEGVCVCVCVCVYVGYRLHSACLGQSQWWSERPDLSLGQPEMPRQVGSLFTTIDALQDKSRLVTGVNETQLNLKSGSDHG